MHVHQCMWHCPRCTKTHCVQKSVKTWVRIFRTKISMITERINVWCTHQSDAWVIPPPPLSLSPPPPFKIPVLTSATDRYSSVFITPAYPWLVTNWLSRKLHFKLLVCWYEQLTVVTSVRCGSASALSEAITISATAACKGVFPSAFPTLGSAPAATRNSIALLFFWATARCSGVCSFAAGPFRTLMSPWNCDRRETVIPQSHWEILPVMFHKQWLDHQTGKDVLLDYCIFKFWEGRN